MCDWAVSWPWYTVCVSQRQPVQQLRPAMMTMGILESDDIHPRGWKASENAERDAIMMMDPSEYSMPMALPPPWYLDTRVLVKIATTCILILLPIIIYVWRSVVSKPGRRTPMREFLYRHITVEDTVDSNGDSVGPGKHDTDIPSATIRTEHDNEDSGGACSCSNMTPQKHMVPVTSNPNNVAPDGCSDGTDGDEIYSEVLSKRTDEVKSLFNFVN